MRKIRKIWIGIIIAVIVYTFFVSKICGSRYHPTPQIPRDFFSYKIFREMGNDIYYYKREKGNSGQIKYFYVIERCDRDTINRFSKILNVLGEKEEKKIAVYVEAKFTWGLSSTFNLKNYSDNNLEKPDYNGFYVLTIAYSKMLDEETLRDPQTYTGIEGIRKLIISEEMQERAEEQGIDWYEIWPDLEEVVVDRVP